MTFSLVVHDPATGLVGVAAMTGMPGVGKLVAHARAQDGAGSRHHRAAGRRETRPRWGGNAACPSCLGEREDSRICCRGVRRLPVGPAQGLAAGV